MWPFKRKKSATDIPSEVQEYYQSERRERVGVAWLLALGTLITTVLLAFGIFFGGRWAYRKITKDDKPAPVATTQQPKPQENKPQTNPPAQTPPPANQNNQTGTSSTNTQQGSSQNQNRPTTPASGTTQGAGTSMPNTGPEHTIAIFIGVSTVAAIGHNLAARRRLPKV